MKRILVTGAGGSAASNFIDSLKISKEKYYIIGTDVNQYHLELSKVDKRYILPHVSNNIYLKKINELIKKEKIDFIHPQPDPEVLFLSRNRQKVDSLIYLPSKEAIELCQNKIQLIMFLQKNNIPVGESYIINSLKDLEIAMKKLKKNNQKIWIRAIKGAGSKASLPVNELDHAKWWLDYWIKMKGLHLDDFMATEFLPGKEFAFQSIWQNGELITSQARERIEYVFGNLTVSGQSSSPSVARTVHREDINKIATEAIKKVDPNASGVFCVDLKENKFGVPCIIEINAGRFFTTSNFFSHAGVNMPHYYIKLAFKEKLPLLKKYNSIPKDLYWIRLIDMGCKLIKNNWSSELL